MVAASGTSRLNSADFHSNAVPEGLQRDSPCGLAGHGMRDAASTSLSSKARKASERARDARRWQQLARDTEVWNEKLKQQLAEVTGYCSFFTRVFLSAFKRQVWSHSPAPPHPLPHAAVLCYPLAQ